MAIHDWRRVSAGTIHDFQCTWLPELKNRLNNGVMPAEYYAQVEQRAGREIADILTLQSGPDSTIDPGNGGAALALAPPRVRTTSILDVELYALRARRIVIRHSSDDRIVSLIELLSPGNKSSVTALQNFVSKATAALGDGIHLMLVDLFPPGARDPQGIHGVTWSALGDASYQAPTEKPLTLVSYAVGPPLTAYVEPVAVGDELTPIPLFLEPDRFVLTPLEESYLAAFHGVPHRWRNVLDA